MSSYLDEIAVAAVCGAALFVFFLILRAARPPAEDPRAARFRQRQLANPPPRINGHAHRPAARESRIDEITILPPKK